jgi:hypothetical protein
VFVIDKSFQPSLAFVGKARPYPRAEKLKYTSLGFPYKDWSKLERLVKDKLSSFLRKLINYDRKIIISFRPDRHHAIQHNDNEHNDIQHNKT